MPAHMGQYFKILITLNPCSGQNFKIVDLPSLSGSVIMATRINRHKKPNEVTAHIKNLTGFPSLSHAIQNEKKLDMHFPELAIVSGRPCIFNR